MTSPLGHEACSELLRPYLEGALDAARAADVRAHLAACADCEAERRALAALLEDVGAPLTEEERGWLRSGVRAAITGPTGSPAPRARRRGGLETWLGRLAPALAAAAVVAVAAVALSNVGGIGDEGGGGATAGDAGGERQRGARVEAPGVAVELPAPRFETAGGTLSVDALRREGRRGRTFRAAAEALAAARVSDAQRRARLATLAQQAAEAGAAVRACGETVLAGSEAVPLTGALGEFEGERALALGFVSVERRDARYSFWVWRAGSCEVPLTSLEGDVPAG